MYQKYAQQGGPEEDHSSDHEEAPEGKIHIMKEQGIKLVDSVKKALFIVGSALVVFIAARNSLTW